MASGPIILPAKRLEIIELTELISASRIWIGRSLNMSGATVWEMGVPDFMTASAFRVD
jgi:hypothetical protein